MPVPPNPISQGSNEQGADQQIEAMKVGSQRRPVLPELHASPAESPAPGQRSNSGVEQETAQGHACDADREGNERANHGQKPADQDSDATVPLKPAFAKLQIARRKQEPAPIAFRRG